MPNESTDEGPPGRLEIDGRAPQLMLILAVAFGLRFWHLDHWSLWYDEVITMRLAQAPGPSAMFDLIRRIDATRAPLFPLLLMGWLRAFGESDFAARSLSAVLGVLTVVAVYATGRSAFDERTGRLAALFCALSPTLVYYSQEVRMYSLLVLLTVLSWWAFLAFRHSATLGHRLGYAALLSALIYTHPIGLFMVAAHCVAYLAVRRHLVLAPGRWIASMGLAAASVLPWIGRYLDHSPEYLLPRFPIRFLLSVPIEYIGGNSLTLLPLAALIAAGLLTLRGRRPALREPIAGGATLCWFVVPPALIYAYSMVGHPIFGPARIHLFVAPAYLLLVARGLALLPRWVRLAAVAAILTLMIHGLASRTYAPGLKVDYRAFARWLRDRGDERAVVVLHNDHSLPQYEAACYYLVPGAEVVLDRGEGPSPSVTPPKGTALYHAYCVRPAGRNRPPVERPIKTFYGLIITRSAL